MVRSAPVVSNHNHYRCVVCQAGTEKDILEKQRRINVMVSTLNEAQRRWYVGSTSGAKGGYSEALGDIPFGCCRG